LIINFIIFIIADLNKNQRLNLSLNTHIEKLQTHFQVLLHEQGTTADMVYDSVTKNKNVLKILQKATLTRDVKKRTILRKNLDKELRPMYNRIHKKGVLQFQFVFFDNTTFYRLHKPTKYDDDLSIVRKDYAYVNETKKIIRGFMQGRTSHSFRNVYPIFDEKKNYLGAMEVSFSSEYLQNNFTQIAHIHTHFLVNKDIFTAKTWSRDDLIVQYNQSRENEHYMISIFQKYADDKYHQENEKKLQGLENKIEKNMLNNKPFGLITLKKDEVVSFIPIQNRLTNEILAWIVSYEKDDFIKGTIKNNNTIRIVLFFILLVLFYFIYKTLWEKESLEDTVALKTMELKDLNENLEQRIIFEVEKSKDMESKLFQSDKLVSMGEMIGNIAHQWRQPLSAISTGATGMKMKKEYNILTDEDLLNTCDNINKHAQYLSQTIDDFRNYIKGDRDKKVFTLKSDIDSFLHLIEGSLKKEEIEIIITADREVSIDGYPNELVQCFINLYNNSKDAFKEHGINKKYIFISSKLNKDNVEIYFKDNACGIDDKIITKVFDPYFTTRHKAQGTGLGLHMSYTLIVEGMLGSFEVHNRTFDYKDEIYTGAEFIITLPR